MAQTPHARERDRYFWVRALISQSLWKAEPQSRTDQTRKSDWSVPRAQHLNGFRLVSAVIATHQEGLCHQWYNRPAQGHSRRARLGLWSHSSCAAAHSEPPWEQLCTWTWLLGQNRVSTRIKMRVVLVWGSFAGSCTLKTSWHTKPWLILHWKYVHMFPMHWFVLCRLLGLQQLLILVTLHISKSIKQCH